MFFMNYKFDNYENALVDNISPNVVKKPLEKGEDSDEMSAKDLTNTSPTPHPSDKDSTPSTTKAEASADYENGQEDALQTMQFLNENYCFRRNLLSGKVEFQSLPAKDDHFRPLSKEALNSIVWRMKLEGVTRNSPRQNAEEYIYSEETPAFNPVEYYLQNLPEWDRQNHVAQLFSRLPGISTEQQNFLTIWLRSAVAHWLQMDMLHGNECVPTLIGAQGCGKTTFVRRLLPPELRIYYLDHLNLSNKFDKEMALTNNLLVNLDEFEAIRPSQHAALKQTLSKSKVNGRPIYGDSQADRPRFASFVATTNNPHPLTDVTGSRRYICIQIPKGMYINNVGDIDYRQLYAQVLYELQEQKAPYWFNNEEVTRLQELNAGFMGECDLAEIISICFRHPDSDENVSPLTCSNILDTIRMEYPQVAASHSQKIKLGALLHKLGYDGKITKEGMKYNIVRKAS